MNLREARVGYAGYSADFGAPGDRRRLCAFARARGLAIERADLAADYDAVLVTHHGDLPGWTARKRREGPGLKLLFELIDSYFTQTGLVRRYGKGLARRALGLDSRWSPDFLRTLIRACEVADVVLCSTEEQAEAIRRYNRNVIVSFDYFGDDLGPPKSEYGRTGGKLRLVWEGQSATLANLRTIRGVLNDLRDKVELHVVTDPLIHRYFGRFLPRPSQEVLRGFECDIHFHPWDRATFSRDVAAADVAIIPIDPSNRFAVGKPDNKLAMLWQLGMPVLASDTPAYRRAMNAADLDLLCCDSADWREKLERLIALPPAGLERLGRQARSFADRAYSKDEFLRRFDQAFALAGLAL
jgi:glycosyltransferase involved in cell wall biosynthesis